MQVQSADITSDIPAVSVNRNVIANFAGSAWSGLMRLTFLPFYVRLIGIESYGIVGIFVSIQAMFAILDLGLSQTLAREMARLSTDRRNASLMADTARTIEVIYWCAAVVVGLIVLSLSDFISNDWLSPDNLSRATLQEAMWAMALVIALRWPVALYTGALIGLQRQILLNALLAVFSTTQGLGALAVLWYIKPTVQYFLLWQGFVALIQVAVLKIVLNECISSPRPGRFRRELVQRLWRFAAGMTGIGLVSMLLTQTDKILLSNLLTLTDFGYYTFATTAAGSLYALIGPVFTAYQPRLAALAPETDQSGLVGVYHQGCQLMTVAIVPAGAVLAFFSNEIVDLWTHDSHVVANASLLISFLMVGNVLHGLMHLPYALQLAFGWTTLAFSTNVIAVIVLVPAIYFSTTRWGAIGAAIVWVLLNLAYLTISAQFMYGRLLKSEKQRWYFNDIIKPIAAVVAVVGAARVLITAALGTPWIEISLILVSVAAVAAALLGADSLRRASILR